MDFSDAFNRMKHGEKFVTRPGISPNYLKMLLDHSAIMLGDSTGYIEWTPTNKDLVATDWEIYFGNS